MTAASYRIRSRVAATMTSSAWLPATSSDDVTVMAATAAAGTRRTTWQRGAAVPDHTHDANGVRGTQMLRSVLDR